MSVPANIDETLIDELEGLISTLSSERVELLVEMAQALTRSVTARVDANSDLVTPAFERDFSGRLLLFHAMHDAALTKKTFEYLFCGASRAAGRTASQTVNSVHPGEDVIVDGHKFSLKTESGNSISKTSVHISKLMEARWIRECVTPEQFCLSAQTKIAAHLGHYERILTLRSFQSERTVLYQLVEIPRSVLLRIASLKPTDFSARTANGSTSATVRDSQGNTFFVLSLDGSVEKITIRRLDIGLCTIHATWQVSVT